jgi:hypothetical protein
MSIYRGTNHYDSNSSFLTSSNLPLIFIGLGFLLIMGMVITTFTRGAFPNYSEGERSGTVYKLSHKGLIFKSYEGEMNLGGMAADANGSMVANTFQFSVRDPAVVAKINEAATSGKRVTLSYTQYAIGPVTLSTPYVIIGVKGIGEK